MSDQINDLPTVADLARALLSGDEAARARWVAFLEGQDKAAAAKAKRSAEIEARAAELVSGLEEWARTPDALRAARRKATEEVDASVAPATKGA